MALPITSGDKTWAFVPRGVKLVGRKVFPQFALVPSPPVDLPDKAYLLAGPPLGWEWDKWKKFQALNQVLRLRMAEHNLTKAKRKEIWRQWAEAARRLPM